jgi:hypothetical protein
VGKVVNRGYIFTGGQDLPVLSHLILTSLNNALQAKKVVATQQLYYSTTDIKRTDA